MLTVEMRRLGRCDEELCVCIFGGEGGVFLVGERRTGGDGGDGKISGGGGSAEKRVGIPLRTTTPIASVTHSIPRLLIEVQQYIEKQIINGR